VAATSVLDPVSRIWIEELRPGHPRHDQAVRRLHDLLHRVALHELGRRRRQLQSIRGPEFYDIAQQAADDAVVSVLAKLEEFRGLSRFTTWAYKFAAYQVSAEVARHAWRRQPPATADLIWDQLPDQTARRPEEIVEQRAELQSLSRAVAELTARQREVVVAVVLNDVPVDVLAVKLQTNRNALYKNLFDARRNLREKMYADAVSPAR
jgi:RNA polymerase sigma-70 factor, ECF subfamily